MNIENLKEKPLWQMTGEEFLFLVTNVEQREIQNPVTINTSKKYVYGILGISKLFNCSIPTANRIKKSGKIDKAITQIGRKIIVDSEVYQKKFVNERCFAWIDSFRTLLIRFDTLDSSWLNWHYLAFALILLKV